MTKIYVPLRRDEIEQLQEMAQAERRRPAEQAAYLLSKALGEQPKQKELAGAAK